MNNNQAVRKAVVPLLMGVISLGIAWLSGPLAGKDLLALSFGFLLTAFALATAGLIQGIKRLRTTGRKTLVLAGMIVCVISIILIVWAGILEYVYKIL